MLTVLLIVQFAAALAAEQAVEFESVAASSNCAASSVTVSARSDIECAVKCSQTGSSLSYSFINGVCVLSDSADCAASGAVSVYRKRAEPDNPTTLPIISPGYQQQIGGRTFWVFQQRQTGQVAFNRTWNDYVSGFGNATEFWIGLESLHNQTSTGNRNLRIEAVTVHGESYESEWLGFTVGDSSTNYRMNYSSFVSGSSTTNCDSLSPHKSRQFSTFDRDNDGKPGGSCSTGYGNGGFWWGACLAINPNGLYSSTLIADSSKYSYMCSTCIGNFKTLRSMRMMLQV